MQSTTEIRPTFLLLAQELAALMQARALARPDEEPVLTARIGHVLERLGKPAAGPDDALQSLEPWEAVLQVLVQEIAAGAFPHPFKVEREPNGEHVLCVRPAHMLAHLRQTNRLWETWRSLPISARSGRALKKDMTQAGVLAMNPDGIGPLHVERTIDSRRVGHLCVVRLERLANVAWPDLH